MSPQEKKPPAPALDDPRVVEALEEYLAAAEAGQPPSRQAFLARHAEIAEALAECLDGLDALQLGTRNAERGTEESSGFTLSQSATRNPGPAAQADLEGAPLGDFRLLREIGRGGMGVVYEAEQLSLGRRVALKVLPFAAALDARHLQRFKNEAQAAAHLHHQHIVPVHGVGYDRGVHYYAMQLIEGQNLAALIGELRGQNAPEPSSVVSLWPDDRGTAPTRSLMGAQLSTQRSGRSAQFFRTVARLAAQAAEALDYAHGVGVVHRDVKPANLLVDGRGHLWVTDFGLAQFHADAGLTQTGDVVGTLRYMSPEQAAGQRVLLDHRTDVYSLGATLYELLTLKPIFEGSDRQSLLQQIMHEEPRPPRAIDRTIPAELETIVLKALGKSPADRYATAGDLAGDLQRFLRHEPILARRATLPQRARKWLRRHPSVLVTGVVLLVLLAVGSLVSAWLIRGEQEKTRLAYEREQQRFQLARRSVDEMIQFANEELADVPHLQSLRKRLLETALVYYQEFIEQRGDDRSAQEELKSTRDRVKKILTDLAVLQGAGQFYLLNNPAVLEDLRLSAEQHDSLTEVLERQGEKGSETFREFGRLTAEERRRRFLELARANESAVEQVLTAAQLHRLRQIALQAQGPMAFREPEVIAALKLTTAQRERIRAIEADVFFLRPDRPLSPGPGPGGRDKGPGSPPPRPPGTSGGPPRRPPEQKNEMALEQIRREVLTAEQTKKWTEMTGEPFKGPIHLRPPGSFGPRGPG
jgi:serine/threonine protein kinase